MLVARPAATVATLGFEEVQVAEPVKKPVLPSLKVPVKVNWYCLPNVLVRICALAGTICSPVSVAEEEMGFGTVVSVSAAGPAKALDARVSAPVL